MVILTTLDVNIVFKDFPNYGKEMVIPNEDGSYTIFINSRLNREQQVKSYYHAMKHITGEDFDKENVQEIEALAHE